MDVYLWIAIGVMLLAFAMMIGLAVYWGSQFGAIGYWYWGIASLIPAGGIMAIYALPHSLT